MSRIETYKDYAAQCVFLAGRLPEGTDRQYLIEMAVRWYELAELLSSFMKEHEGQEPEFNWPRPPQGPSNQAPHTSRYR